MNTQRSGHRLYDLFEPWALVCKIALQMLVGVSIVSLLLIKLVLQFSRPRITRF